MQHVFVSRLVGGVSSARAGRRGARRRLLAAGDRRRQRRAAAGRVHQRRCAVRRRPRRAQRRADAPSRARGRRQQPAIAISNFGKAYLAFTAAGAGGHDVRAAYYYPGNWALEPTPLDAAPADDAGTGSGRPAVAAAGDGVGIVAWGEGGHIYTRRVWGTSPSIAYEQADLPSLSGWNEVSADRAGVGARRRLLVCRGRVPRAVLERARQQSRVLMRRLQGSPVRRPRGRRRALDARARGATSRRSRSASTARVRHLRARDTNELLRDVARHQRAPGPTIRGSTASRTTAAPIAVPALAGLHSD